MKKILITGAAGDVGSHLRRELAGRYALRLSDIRPIRNLAKGEEFIRGDCANLRDMLRVTKGVDAVVHLAVPPRGLERVVGADDVRAQDHLPRAFDGEAAE